MTLDLAGELKPELADGKRGPKAPAGVTRPKTAIGPPAAAGRGASPATPAVAKGTQEARSEAADPHLAPAQRSAAAAKEAAAQIRARAAQYRLTADGPRTTTPAASRPPPQPAPAPATPTQVDRSASQPGEAADEASPAPQAVEPAPKTETASPGPMPPDSTEPASTPEIADAESSAPAAPFRPRTRTATHGEADERKTAFFTFKPMRQSEEKPAPFTTAYGFQSEVASRSAGALLIGQVRPIRPASPDRLLAEAPSSEAQPPEQRLAGALATPEPQPEGPATQEDTAARFDRLSQEIAEQTRRLGFDPGKLGAGELQTPSAPPSRWSWLPSWLRGGD